MVTTTPEQPVIQFSTTSDVPKREVARARQVVSRVLSHVPEPVLYAKVTLSFLKDPAVPHPALASIRVDVNGRPVNAHAAAASMSEAIALAGDRLRVRLEHMPRHRKARRAGHGTTEPETTASEGDLR